MMRSAKGFVKREVVPILREEGIHFEDEQVDSYSTYTTP